MHYSFFEKRASGRKMATIPRDVTGARAKGRNQVKKPMKIRLRGVVTALGIVLVATFGGIAPATGETSAPDGAGRPSRAGDVFTVYAVPVDVTARNAAIARTLAIRDGERRAFSLLIQRLVMPEHVDRFANLEPARISDLVLGLQFANERSSQVRYIADLTIRFNADKVRTLFRETETPFTQTPGLPLVVLPVLEYAGSRLLWESGNSWYRAWASQDLVNPLLPYVLPEGSVRDQLTVNPFQAMGRDPAQRRLLASAYGAAGAFVPLATVTPDFRDGGVKVAVTWLHDDMAIARRPKETGPEVQVFRARKEESLEDTLRRVAAAVIAARDRIWKERTLIRLDETREIRARVPLRSMEDWAQVQRRLDQVNLIQSVTLSELSVGEARVNLSFAGRADQLVLALSQRDLVLRGYGDDVYIILGEIAGAREITPQFDFVPPGEQVIEVIAPKVLNDWNGAVEDAGVAR
ncbi:MAG: DUF2066 domain-containing protein [Alphaproteobacteria bacterium]|nr:MAG: DUF2066 domain-containing protein [Alphaproteobacteria bacterium]